MDSIPVFFYVICLVFRIPIRSGLQKICFQDPDPAAGNSKTLNIFVWSGSGSGIWIRIEIFAWIRIRKKKNAVPKNWFRLYFTPFSSFPLQYVTPGPGQYLVAPAALGVKKSGIPLLARSSSFRGKKVGT